MNAEKIKNSMEYLTRLNNVDETTLSILNVNTKFAKKVKDTIEHRKTALEALKNELDRQENKPLEVSELQEMIDKPVWVKSDNKIYDMWDIVRKVEDVWGGTFRVITDDNIHTSEWNSFHKYEPSKVTD